MRQQLFAFAEPDPEPAPVSGAISAPAIVILAVVLGAVLSLLVGCGPIANEKTRAAEDDLKAAVTEALADGVLGSAETAIILGKMDDVLEAVEEQGSAVNWKEVLGGVGAAVVTTVLGLRAAPNSVILGRKEAAALDRITPNAP